MFASHVARLLPLSDRDVALRDGQRVFLAGETVRHLFVVREGGVQMLRRQASGAALVVQRVQPGGLLAEASLFAARYHCDATATGRTLLARIPKARVVELQAQEPGWLLAFAAHRRRRSSARGPARSCCRSGKSGSGSTPGSASSRVRFRTAAAGPTGPASSASARKRCTGSSRSDVLDFAPG
ncbi:cyclic nucleotide-binding domain-containing protein [Ramlibacter terrae]|uniref:Cyclic nucleotide-binding domain-containing protein n=1 Tax=Ramlibacter terrae TaxID=2732511 RepID=A0ABX6P1V9_9BURK|nr:cyclic nucleotide-binding domain-containing protein [Ramlibacter terrae]